MAKRKAKLASGMQIRVRPGVFMPEFESLDIGGWTGMVLETTGKGADQKVILEWSPQCLSQMPDDYVRHCESQGLFHGMACLPLSALDDPAEAD
jgi:hypothetical protein